MEVENNGLIEWPPQFTFKRHSRARHVKLKASHRHGLEIIVPLRFNFKNIPEILETNKSWIIKKLLELQQNPVKSNELPEVINLNACEQVWRVTYIKSDNKKLKLITRQPFEVVIFGNVEEKNECFKLLINWAKLKASQYLLDRLQDMSYMTGLRYHKAIIRGQRGRWGSCNSAKTISLNYKLIFLPPQLATHVIIHELCHTMYLNHSTKFWRLVASHDPDWKQHNRDLRRGDEWVPGWVE